MGDSGRTADSNVQLAQISAAWLNEQSVRTQSSSSSCSDLGGLLWAGVEREQAYAELQNALREGHQDVLTVQKESEVPWVAADFRVESINQLMDKWAVNHGLIIEDEEHQTSVTDWLEL